MGRQINIRHWCHIIGKNIHWLPYNGETYMVTVTGIWGMGRDWEFLVLAVDWLRVRLNEL